MSIFKSSTKLIKFYVQTTYICHINIKWLISSHLGKKFFSPSATTFVYIKWDLWGPDSFSYQNRIFQHQLSPEAPWPHGVSRSGCVASEGWGHWQLVTQDSMLRLVTQQVEREGDKLLFFSVHTCLLSLWSGLCVKGKDDQGPQHQEPWTPASCTGKNTHSEDTCSSKVCLLWIFASQSWMTTYILYIDISISNDWNEEQITSIIIIINEENKVLHVSGGKFNF